MDAQSQQIATWLEDNLGGRVVEVSRQARWRPVWFADLEQAHGVQALCIRGERTDANIGFSLDHEMRFQRVLEAHEIPVARVHGWIDDPRAYVMDRVPGHNDFSQAGEAERRGVMDEYMGILARIHALPPEPFSRAGILRAEKPADSGRVGIQRYEEFYRRSKRRPDPFLEFCLAWLARNPLDNRGREAPIVWDSGQFHHAQGRIQAILDLEIGHVGDPMMDLAAFRMRDTVIGFGEFPKLYRRYQEISGTPIDIAAIQHYHLAFTLTNQLAFHAALADPSAESDFMTNMQWCSETNLFAVEALAEILEIDLPEIDLPAERDSSAATAHRHLVTSLRHLDANDDYVQHQIRIAFRLARHLQRADEIGDAVALADLEDIAQLTGQRPESWRAGDEALERFVLADGGRHDEALVRLFHRRLSRYKMLLGPPGSAMARHLPIQRFGSRES